MTRRSVLEILVRTIRGAVAACAAVPVLRFLLAPLNAKQKSGGFVRLAPLSTLESGEVKREQVVTDRWDSFTHYPPGPIGSVWLVREDQGNGEPRVRCLQSICPHLGCAVDHNANGGGFRCPCHGAVFDATGKRVSGPAPRGMDELEVRIAEGDDGQHWVEVNYQTFVIGTPQQTPKA